MFSSQSDNFQWLLNHVSAYKAQNEEFSLDGFVQHVANQAKISSFTPRQPLGEINGNNAGKPSSHQPSKGLNRLHNSKAKGHRKIGSTPSHNDSHLAVVDSRLLSMTKDAVAKRRSLAKIKEEITMLDAFNKTARKLVNLWKGGSELGSEELDMAIRKCAEKAQKITEIHIEGGFRPGGSSRHWHMGGGLFLNLPLEYFIFRFVREIEEEVVFEDVMATLAGLLDQAKEKTSEVERKEWCKNNAWDYVRLAVVAEDVDNEE